MNLRKILFWTHLCVGLTAGLVILSMCVTGTMLAFEPQLVEWAEHRVRFVAPPASASRLPVETLLAKAAETRPQARPAMMALRSDPAASVMIGFGKEGALYLNPYTGEALGKESKIHGALHDIEDFHRWFGNKKVGKPITGIGALAFFGLGISGLVLWWPRNTSVKEALKYKPGLQGKARDWNWHTVTGFWVSPIFLVIALTGIVMSYGWANTLLFKLAGSPPPIPPADRREPPPTPDPFSPAGFNRLGEKAEMQSPGWKSISFKIPPQAEAPVVFMILEPNAKYPSHRSGLTLDRKTGDVLKWEPFSELPNGRQARSWIVPMHTGRAWGVIGQTVNFLAACAGILLIWTGFALAWRRFVSSRRVK